MLGRPLAGGNQELASPTAWPLGEGRRSCVAELGSVLGRTAKSTPGPGRGLGCSSPAWPLQGASLLPPSLAQWAGGHSRVSRAVGVFSPICSCPLFTAGAAACQDCSGAALRGCLARRGRGEGKGPCNHQHFPICTTCPLGKGGPAPGAGRIIELLPLLPSPLALWISSPVCSLPISPQQLMSLGEGWGGPRP